MLTLDAILKTTKQQAAFGNLRTGNVPRDRGAVQKTNKDHNITAADLKTPLPRMGELAGLCADRAAGCGADSLGAGMSGTRNRIKKDKAMPKAKTDTTTNAIEPVQYPERMKVIFTESGLVRLWTAGDVPDSLAGLPVAEYVNAAALTALTALTAERDGLQSELAAVKAERDAMRARVGALAALIEMIDEAWCGLTQTQLAASAVGVSMANSVRNEGYGLNLKIAIYEARALAGKAGA